MAIGMTEVLLILIIILILFGPKKLPELARAIGQSVREYKQAVNDEGPKPKKSSKHLKG
jgi:sec-independent protein translocase protein TatA